MRKPGVTLSIYKKLMMVYFVMLLPFVLLNVYNSHTTVCSLREQHISRMKTALSAEVEDYDAERFRVFSGMKAHISFGNEAFLATNYNSLSSYQLGIRVRELFSDLEQISQISALVNDIVIYMPRIERAVSLMKYYDDKITEEEAQRIQVYQTSGQHFMRLQDAFRIQIGSNSISDQTPLFVIEATLSDSKLLTDLNKRTTTEKYAILGENVLLCESFEEENLKKVSELILESGQQYGNFTLDNRLYCFHRMSMCENYMVSYIPESQLYAPMQIFQINLYVTLILAILCSAFIFFYLSRVINRPFQRLISLFQDVKNSDLFTEPVSVSVPKDEFSMVFDQYNIMLSQIHELVDKRVEQEKALQMAEYRQMQAHIAPHFLYNSFNVLRHCVLTGDTDTAEQMTRLMGSYFKYLTYKGDQKSITLLEEYRHVLDYLDIQKIRFQNNISIEVTPLPDEFSQLLVPPFILQPLVENVFKHGLNDIAFGGEILLTTQLDGDELNLIVRDNGAGMDVTELAKLRKALRDNEVIAEHSGLINIHQRLRLHSGDRCRVEVYSQPGEYFEARICLCIVEDNNNDTYSGCR